MIRVPRMPALFRTAEHPHNECGPYQLRAILNAYGFDAPAAELYWSAALRRFDWSLPFFIPRILRRYGIKARTRFWPRASFARKLVNELARSAPALFVIRAVSGRHRLHWISAWGYDEATREFLCYDSQAPSSAGGCGNVRYGAALLTQKLPWRGTFAITILGAI